MERLDIPRELWENLIDCANKSTVQGTVGDYRAKAVVFGPGGLVAYGHDLLHLSEAQGLALNLPVSPEDRIFTVSREWTYAAFEVHELERSSLRWRLTRAAALAFALPEWPPFQPGTRSRPSGLAARS